MAQRPADTISDFIVGAFTRFTHELLLLFIVYPIETMWRLWCHLDPRLYSERLRIRRISEGQVATKGDRFVLFVLYARTSIPPFIQTVIDAIGRSRLNLVITTNARISPELRATLLEQCHLLIERADLGRDFGGYKDGISIIEKRYGVPERLILLNDSLFFFEKGVDKLIADLDGDEDLIGITEDLDLYYHIQSFALSFGRNVLKHRRVRKYWHTYRPVSTRYWAVHNGERLLTARLVRAGFRPKILYHASQLLPHLRTNRLIELMEAVYLLPQSMRERFYRELDELRDTQALTALTSLDTVSKSIRRLHKVESQDVAKLRDVNIETVLQVSHQIAKVHGTREQWAIETFGERIAGAVGDRNQIHAGGFLFMKYLGVPVMKRDLFYREVYGIEEIDEILSNFQVSMKNEIMAEIRQKGSGALHKGIRKILYNNGAI